MKPSSRIFAQRANIHRAAIVQDDIGGHVLHDVLVAERVPCRLYTSVTRSVIRELGVLVPKRPGEFVVYLPHDTDVRLDDVIEIGHRRYRIDGIMPQPDGAYVAVLVYDVATPGLAARP